MTVNFPQRRRSASMAAVALSATLALAACGDDSGDSAADATTPTAEETATSATEQTTPETTPVTTPETTPETTPATTAESSSAATGETRTVEAENGTIEIPAVPQRIVTIGNVTMPFIDLGGQPVGVTEAYPAELLGLPAENMATYEAAVKVGEEEVDLEQIASLEPDLILVQFHASDWDAIGTQLEAIAPTVFFGLDLEWKEMADAIAVAGNVTGKLDEQKAAFAEKVAGIQETYGAIIESTTFVDVSRGDWNDPGMFYIADIGCSEIGRDDVGLDLPEAAEGADPLAYENLSFEQLSSLAEYDVITYPVDAEGQPMEPFVPVLESNTWQALPAVTSGRALGIFCPGNGSYGPVLQYLDSLDNALATLPTE
jgi:iron complex transport system substrate-binding protein